MNKSSDFYIQTIQPGCKLYLPEHIIDGQKDKASFIELILIKSGYIVRDSNFHRMRINSQEIHLSVAGTISQIKECSEDMEGCYCMFTPSFLSSVATHEHLGNEVELICSFLYHYPLRLNGPAFQRISTDLAFITQLYSITQPDFFLIYIYLLASIYEIKKVMHESHLDFYPARAFFITKEYTRLLSSHIEKEHHISFYAGQLNISANHLNKSVRAVTGRTAMALLTEMRLMEAKRRLASTDLPVNEIAFQLGFEDPSYFSRFFRKATGVSPVKFRMLKSQ